MSKRINELKDTELVNKRSKTEVEQEGIITSDTDEKEFKEKLQLGNIGKYKTKKDVQKLLESLSIQYSKIKIAPKWTHCFINFDTRADLDVAREKLEGYEYKNNVLYAKLIKPQVYQAPELKEFVPNAPIDELISNQVIPWWKLDYEKQIEQKQDYIQKNYVTLKNQLKKFLPRKQFNHVLKLNEGESTIDWISILFLTRKKYS